MSAVTGRVFVAQNPEQFTYDADGNMLTDGRFRYTWNGENRLVRAQELVAPTNRHPYTVAYAYDHRGRMVSKRITENDGHDTLVKSISYLWDGWNIIQETTIDNCQTVQPSNYHALIREYDDLRLDYDDHFEGHDKLLNDINASIVTREAAWRQVEQYKARMERRCGQ